MSAGLPGVGLSGVFFILSALVTLPLELARTIRGQSSLARWAAVTRHLAIAITMVVGVELAYSVMHLAIEHVGSPAAKTRFHLLPLAPVAATLGVIALLVLGAKAAHVLSQWRKLRGIDARLHLTAVIGVVSSGVAVLCVWILVIDGLHPARTPAVTTTAAVTAVIPWACSRRRARLRRSATPGLATSAGTLVVLAADGRPSYDPPYLQAEVFVSTRA